jgi:S-DNA-T family DNA segregation ATPase FtsK/SpoIIIE
MVKLILVDPKVVEMAPFKDIPHLMAPVINDAAKATSVLEWACEKMDERYEFLAEAGVRNIKGYNGLTQEELVERFNPGSPEEEAKIPKKMPYIVIIIDELADLMMTVQSEIEKPLTQLAQKARAIGIHLIVATQRPSVNVITGLIKANFPSRIAFRVSSKVDSRTILDQNGADALLGNGDMLFLPPGRSDPVRIQGAYVSTEDTERLMQSLTKSAEARLITARIGNLPHLPPARGNHQPAILVKRKTTGFQNHIVGKRHTAYGVIIRFCSFIRLAIYRQYVYKRYRKEKYN